MQNFMADKAASAAGNAMDQGWACWAAAQPPRHALALKKGGPDALTGEAGFFAGAFGVVEAEGPTEEFIRTEPQQAPRSCWRSPEGCARWRCR
ncbi:MAG: hypothetical protein U0792_13665 [Gemmataceae bacterium]